MMDRHWEGVGYERGRGAGQVELLRCISRVQQQRRESEAMLAASVFAVLLAAVALHRLQKERRSDNSRGKMHAALSPDLQSHPQLALQSHTSITPKQKQTNVTLDSVCVENELLLPYAQQLCPLSPILFSSFLIVIRHVFEHEPFL